MSHALPFTWIVRYTVAPVWVADGFSLCDIRAHEMLAQELRMANGSEFAAAVLAMPDPKAIAHIQGYERGHPRRAEVIKELRSNTRAALLQGEIDRAMAELGQASHELAGNEQLPARRARDAIERARTQLMFVQEAISPRQGKRQEY